MAENAFESIATVTGTGSSASVSFNSFSGYTDLKLVIYKPTSIGCNVEFNGDSGNNYSNKRVLWTGTGLHQDSQSNQPNFYGNVNSSVLNVIEILDYANTTRYKTILSRNSQTSSAWGMQAHQWRSNSAITSIRIFSGEGNFTTNDTFTLYGIKAA